MRLAFMGLVTLTGVMMAGVNRQELLPSLAELQTERNAVLKLRLGMAEKLLDGRHEVKRLATPDSMRIKLVQSKH